MNDMDVTIIPLCTLIGVVMGWYLKQRCVSAEIGKLKAEKNKLEQERIKYAGDNLTKLQESRRSYDNACEECKQISLRLCDELKGQSEAVATTREELCTALYNKVIPLYLNLIEWEQLSAKDDPKKLCKLIEEVVAELRRFKKWVQIVNHDRFLKVMGLSPSKVSKRTLSPFLLMLEDLSTKDKCAVETMLRNVVSELINEGLKS